MLIRSNRSFQGGGNGETIVPEESRPLKVPEEEKWMLETDGVLPGVSPLFFPLSPLRHFTFPFSCLSL